ncbi:MAG: LysR family transcriptional regulator [Streptosporangiales bacterium]|nr:LysR family transcriptional regulator [Streptosporangiales bacterium]
MTLQQLAYFVAVAETRHFTRAAQASHVAQPSLSRQVHALERELGAPLFSRTRGNVALTPSGEALLPLARRILADTETARTEVLELIGLRRGRLRLGATPSLCVTLVADVLRRFHDSYPGIELEVTENGSRDLVRQLDQGELDVALVIVPASGADERLVLQPLLREDLVVASPAGEPPPTRRSRFRLADLRDRPLVMFREGYDLRDVTLQACQQAGVRPRLSVEGGEMDAVLRFVEAGLGIAIVPSMVLADRAGLRATPLAAPGLSRTIALAHRSGVTPIHAARAFGTTLLETVADSAARGGLPSGVRRVRAAT